LEISSNQAANSGTGTGLESYTAITPGSADHYSEVTLTGLQATSDEGPGPAVRVLTASMTGYFAQCNTTEIKLYRVNAGSFHTGTGAGNFATYSGDAAGAAVNDVIRIEVSGVGATVTIVVKKNGTTVITATDTDASRLTATGNWGMWAGGGSAAHVLLVDDWSGADLSAGPTAAQEIPAILQALSGGIIIGRVDA
jgi:hypothetical protein